MRISIKHKDKLYYAYKICPSVHNEMICKFYKSHLHKLLKTAEKYYHSLIFQKKRNMIETLGYYKKKYHH